MYSLKFVNFHNSDSTHASTTHVVSCDSFQVLEFSNRTSVIAYKGMTTEEGVEFTLMSDKEFSKLSEDNPAAPVRHYARCYVENINGKTINVINP